MRQFNIPIFIIVSLVFCSCQKLNVSLGESELIPLTSDNILNNNWEFKKVTENTNPIYDIYFKNKDTGFAITGFGIYRSFNGGITWEKQNFRIENIDKRERYFPFINLTVTSNNNIYVAANAQALKFSSGFSDSLIGQKILPYYAGSEQRKVVGVYAIDDSNIYFSYKDSLLFSNNAGLSWKILSQTNSSNSSTGYSSLFFLSRSLGIWSNGTSLLVSQGSDSVWKRSNFMFNNQIQNVALPSSQTAFVSTKNGLFKSSRGFDSFDLIFKTIKENRYMSISFVDENIGYISYENYIYKTKDGGKTWNLEVALVNPKYEMIYEIHAIDEENVWACTASGGVLRKK